MRILRVHNRYQERGGEDAVFDAEIALLRRHHHFVTPLCLSNDEIPTRRTVANSVSLAINTVWSQQGRERIRQAVARHKPDVVHFDNTFPLISPAAYSAVRDAGSAVVQTLHNYRLLCPNAFFYRDDRPCEDCLGKTAPYPGVTHACYRESRTQSAVVAIMLTTHRLRGTWSKDVDRYIVPTEFARGKFLEGGLPEDHIVVKPHFVDVESPVRSSSNDHFLFVGRLSIEKGLRTLLKAQKGHGQPVRIVGGGPLDDEVRSAASRDPSLTVLGRLDPSNVRKEMLAAKALIFPSELYETFGLVAIEGFAAGLPVIASRHGAMAEIVDDGRTGLLFEPGNAHDLAAKARWAADHPDEMRRLGENARREYEEKYTSERNYEMLMKIYEQAIHHARRRHEK